MELGNWRMVMGKRERLEKILKGSKGELKKIYGIKEMGIFGSYVRGENKKGSDIDILVEFGEDSKIGLLKFLNLENYLSGLLGTKVDLVMRSSLKPRIGRHILEEVVYL